MPSPQYRLTGSASGAASAVASGAPDSKVGAPSFASLQSPAVPAEPSVVSSPPESTLVVPTGARGIDEGASVLASRPVACVWVYSPSLEHAAALSTMPRENLTPHRPRRARSSIGGLPGRCRGGSELGPSWVRPASRGRRAAVDLAKCWVPELPEIPGLHRALLPRGAPPRCGQRDEAVALT
jgi:hypothetical protein